MANKNEITIHSNAAEYLTFIATTGGNQNSIEMRYEDESIWLTQKMMAALYAVEVNTVNYHIKNYSRFGIARKSSYSKNSNNCL